MTINIQLNRSFQGHILSKERSLIKTLFSTLERTSKKFEKLNIQEDFLSCLVPVGFKTRFQKESFIYISKLVFWLDYDEKGNKTKSHEEAGISLNIDFEPEKLYFSNLD